MKAERKMVFSSMNLPNNIQEQLFQYIKGTDLSVSNGNYIKYPYLFDWDEHVNDFTELDNYFLSNGAVINDGYVIIEIVW